MREFTDITVLVDRSGSMASIRKEMESAFDTFLTEHKREPSTRITLIQFDDVDDQEVQYTAMSVRKAERLELRPRGNTPLLDAFCKAIDRTGRRLASMPEQERPDQVLFVVITDGQENCSKQYRRHDVANRVSTQRNNYNWQFIYLGANQDAIKEAATFNIPMWNTMTYSPDSSGMQGMARALAVNTMNYATRCSTAPDAFTDDQRKKALTNQVDSATILTSNQT